MKQKIKVSRKAIWIAVSVLLVIAAGAGIFTSGILSGSKFSLDTGKKDESNKAASKKTEETYDYPPPAFVADPNAKPDALIHTQSLTDLSKDILKQSLLKEILTEDFVFYYQETEGYLSLKGSLKRIAFEHEMTLFDEVLAYALVTPAEIAFWESYNGKLDHFMVVLEQNFVTKLMSLAAQAASNDTQLSKFAEKSEAGETFTIYKLKHSAGKEIYMTGIRNKWVLFTHPEMPLERVVQAKDGQKSFADLYDPQKNQAKHSLYFSTAFLSFGYQKFFPGLETVKFRYQDGAGWGTDVLMTSKAQLPNFQSGFLWKAAPKSPSLCAALPVDLASLESLAKSIVTSSGRSVDAVISRLESPLAVCWYPESEIYTPVVIAKLKTLEKAQADQGLEPKHLHETFEQSTNNLEAGILSPEEMEIFKDQRRRMAEGELIEDPIRATKFEPPLPVQESKEKSGYSWTREISSRYGIYDAEKSAHQKQMRSRRFFKVKLALVKGHLVFSPDDRLVNNVISVLDKRAPALSETLSTAERTGLVIFPGKLAGLLKQATLDSLPAEQESVFRESVSRRLFPAFDKMNQMAGVSILWPQDLSGNDGVWKEITWQSLSSK